MKKGIHPKYEECTIVCACGNTVHTRATKKTIHVEICSSCHPFYTGKQKLVDSAGMVERFEKRYSDKKKETVKKGKINKPVQESPAASSETAEKPAPEESGSASPEK